MDVRHVANAVLNIANFPLEANVQFMTDHGNKDAVHWAGLSFMIYINAWRSEEWVRWTPRRSNTSV